MENPRIIYSDQKATKGIIKLSRPHKIKQTQKVGPVNRFEQYGGN